ncbi:MULTISPECIES: S8 family serine peptidase [unclassified Streptomyces]|uniref:S8 family serine peptidase n=1 Tax=unclassified Streptomyces TaxID=2593676 RepID=UPI000A932E07|nr:MULTISPECIES: S8 family serine peptidase [unclassified Streptomyces]
MTLYQAHRRGLLVLGTAVAALASVFPVSANAATGHPPDPAVPFGAPSGAARSGAPRTLTLITGDKVAVTAGAGGPTTVTVTDAHGRAAGAHVMTQGEHTWVYPDAALPYVASGALDPALFDVTGLLADGYDDAHSDRLPVIVSYTDAAFRSRATTVPKGARRTLTLDSVQGAALSADHSSASVFWKSLTGEAAHGARAASGSLAGGIAKVWLDGKAKALLADSTAQIGAPKVWKDGDTGQGVDVAVLDTGVDTGHPDLAGQISASASFVPGESVEDGNGHGTHVASTVAGTGAASDGREKGVAPGASLHIGKVLDDSGSGQDSWILAGMEWAARNQHARIISMSLGSGPSDGTDPMSQAVNRLSAETGALFVIAAGNSGPGPSSVSAPGAADAALTVGAVDGSDRLASFSSRGPRLGDGGLKPDLTAPGVGILAARAARSPEGEGPYMSLSGTSMATPHVAGAAALLSREHPGWTGQQLKDALVSTTVATSRYSPYAAGAGRLDVAAAVHGTLYATGSAFARPQWPYPDGGTVRRDVTYTNTGAAPVTLDLTLGTPGAPAGLFTLTDSRVTVPAHGTATVGVLTRLGPAADDTSYSGFLDASAADGTAHVRTTVGVNKESRRALLSVTTKDRHGAGLPGQLVLKDITRNTVPQVVDIDGSGRLNTRLRPGTYAAWLYADVPGLDDPHSLSRAVLTAPEVVVDGDRSLVLDASRLRRLTAVTPKRTTNAYVRLDQYRSYRDLVPFHEGYQLEPWKYDSVWVTPTPEVTRGSYTFTSRWRQVQPRLTVVAGSHTYASVLPQTMSPSLPEGAGGYRAVDAGTGSADDFARVHAEGRVAVVRRDDAVTPVDQARAAASAGARLLLIVNDGTGPLDAWADLPEGAPLPVASVGTDEGRDLLARFRHGGTPVLRVTSHPYPDHLYDLLLRHDGSVPPDLTYRPGPGDLARIDVTDRDTRQGEAVDMRSDVSPDGTWAVGTPVTAVRAQGSHTAWVTAGPDAVWVDAAAVPDLTETGPARSYRPRGTSEATWFGGVQHPRLLGDSVIDVPPARVGDLVALYGLPAYGDSGGHAGSALDPAATVRAALYQGDELLAEGDDRISAEVAPDTLPYRLVADTTRDLPGRPYSTRTHTEWEFRSGHADATALHTLPLAQLDYAVATDLSGRARRRTEVTVTPSHLAGVAGGKFGIVTLDVSYDDGATWHRAATTGRSRGEGTRFRLEAPAGARFVTLRASARDGAGSGVTQTVVRAFGLK